MTRMSLFCLALVIVRIRKDRRLLGRPWDGKIRVICFGDINYRQNNLWNYEFRWKLFGGHKKVVTWKFINNFGIRCCLSSSVLVFLAVGRMMRFLLEAKRVWRWLVTGKKLPKALKDPKWNEGQPRQRNLEFVGPSRSWILMGFSWAITGHHSIL